MSPLLDSGTIRRQGNRRRKKQRKLRKCRVRIKAGVTPLVEKYWRQRYDLFAKYDEGIKLDEEGWYSVTPEEIAIRHARHCRGSDIVIDCFAGVGGNAIQFARVCHHVAAIDIDPKRIALAMNNAKIYGVEDRIDFIVGDFFQLASSLKVRMVVFKYVSELKESKLILLSWRLTESCAVGDVVFLSPPWGGPSYKRMKKFSLELLKPKAGYYLFQVACTITPNIIFYLPRNVDIVQVEELSWLYSPPLEMEIEENMIQASLKGITVYYGDVAFGQLGLQ